MKSWLPVLAAAVCWLAASSAIARTWTERGGKTTEGTFVRVHEGSAIVRSQGRVVRLPLATLSEEDREFIRTELEDNGEPIPPELDPSLDAGPAPGLGLGGVPAPVGPQPVRIWTDAQGRQVEASFVSLDGNTVVLDRGGSELRVALDSLSPADQTYVQNLGGGASGGAATVPGVGYGAAPAPATPGGPSGYPGGGYAPPSTPYAPPVTPYTPPSTPGYTPPTIPEYTPPSFPEYTPPSTPSYTPPMDPGYGYSSPSSGYPSAGYTSPSTPSYTPPATPSYSPPSMPSYTPPSMPSYSPPSMEMELRCETCGTLAPPGYKEGDLCPKCHPAAGACCGGSAALILGLLGVIGLAARWERRRTTP